jgi:glycosyltransferase involved in cell wall biosynthesis
VRTARGINQDGVVFGVFGGLTPEKRVPQVLEAFASVLPYAPDAHLLMAGAPAEHYDVAADVQRLGLGERVTITGYLDDERELTACIAACDVALSLRWPTAREVSGPWLRALAAGRATIIMDLEHLADVPSLDPRTWTLNRGADAIHPPGRRSQRPPLTAGLSSFGATSPSAAPRVPSPGSPVPSAVTVAIDVLDEAHSLRLGMRRLASDADLRRTLGAAAREYWRYEHSPERMVADYLDILPRAAAKPVPHPVLPPHLVNDGDRRLHLLLADVGVGSPWDKL